MGGTSVPPTYCRQAKGINDCRRPRFLLRAPLSGELFGPLTVEPLGSQDAYRWLNRSALAENRPSEATPTTLRRYDLLDSFRPWPDETIAALHSRIVGLPHAWSALFALAELSYLRGREPTPMTAISRLPSMPMLFCSRTMSRTPTAGSTITDSYSRDIRGPGRTP
jgi:hypothetical protein